MSEKELLTVEFAAAKAAVSRSVLEDAVREARGTGASLRKIAAVAGMSHEQVRRICSSTISAE